jgi:hypothetical protein
MAIANWLSAERALSPVAMTILAQSIDPTNTGLLDWDIFFPRRNVGSVDLQSITATENRFVSDRREWNARGRRIPELTPITKPVSIIPIEANKSINEYEMQKLSEAAGTNQEIFRRMARVSIPNRVEDCTRANYRRVQVDADTAWSTGIITQKNPETGTTFPATQLSDSTRYLTAGTAWNDTSLNAYDTFLAWCTAARAKVGSLLGARTKLAVVNAILADAPDLPNGVLMTRGDLEDRISADLGFPFRFNITDQSFEVFTDGGTATTTTQSWPAGRIAAIPAGGQIGYTAFAPVKRAQDLVAQVGAGPGIDTNGMTVYYAERNDGRELAIEVQANALPILDPNRIYVTNTGVT